jgi:nifR3 family TIM-barrel protein
MSYVPFLHARELLQGRRKSLALLSFQSDERPVVYQLYDNNEDNLSRAARQLQEHQPDVIDINMACSIRSISARGAGAGLLRDPRKAGRIIHRLSSELEIPVSAKMRLGWDADSMNYLDVARTIEENGASLIAVHGRTRQQRFDGKADWDAIAAIKQAVDIPVIGNGDVRSVEDIGRLKSHSGCDAIMIGRAAIGNPWIFTPRPRAGVPRQEVGAVIAIHLESMLRRYAETHAIMLFRKHLVRYIEPFSLPAALRERLLKACDMLTLLDVLRQADLADPHPGV